MIITLDPEHTIFLNGKLEEDKSADVVAWMLTSYYEQKEELAAVKDIAKKSKKAAKKRGEDVEEIVSDLPLKRPLITMVLNSPGGNYDELTAIYDMMQLLDADIRTIVMGGAMSAGALLAIAGTCGQRLITPSSRLMFHAVSMGIEGKAQDIKIDYKESERLNRQIAEFIKTHSKVTEEEVHKFIDRDIYVLPEEAIQLGMFDAVITGIQ
jgi:ATP-dependent Clp endopeptidase proteolytic subunit ClpP